MTDEVKNEYLRPFKEKGEGRRPTLTFPRNIPFDKNPGETYNDILYVFHECPFFNIFFINHHFIVKNL